VRADAEAGEGEGCKRVRKTGKQISKVWLTCAVGDVSGKTDEVLEVVEVVEVVEGVGEAGGREDVWEG